MIALFFTWLNCITIPVDGPFELPVPVEREIKSEYLPLHLQANIDTIAWRAWQSELETTYVETDNIDYRIAWAAVELLTGDPGMALLVLEPLQALFPARADIHLLLSLAYEKTARNRKALASAERFYKIKPNGCAGTSQLHLSWLKVAADPLKGPEKIINTKIEDYLVDFRKTQTNPTTLKAWEVRKVDVWNFLKQRLVLFSIPNSYVGQMMLDMGDFHYLTKDEKGAEIWYLEALKWDSGLQPKVNNRIDMLHKGKFKLVLWLIIGGLVSVLAILLVYRMKTVDR